MTLPPMLRDEPIGATGRKSEKRLGQRLQAQSQPASGALAGAKGDLVLPGVLLEAKSTTMASIQIKLDWLAKIASEARWERKNAALAITFTTGDGRPRPDGSWVMVSEALFQKLLEGKH